MLDFLVPAALNHLLAGADWARARLLPFAGSDLKLLAPPASLTLLVDKEGYFAPGGGESPAVTLTLPAISPFSLLEGLGEGQALEALLREARIEGKAEFAQTLGFVLRNLRWDYEEDLSRIVGDIAAHRIAGGVSGLLRWQRQAVRNLAENFVEYTTEEQPILLKPADARVFGEDVVRLGEGLDALEARLRRLRPAGRSS